MPQTDDESRLYVESEVMTLKRGYEIGLEKLVTAEAGISHMEQALKDKEPLLVEKTAQQEAFAALVDKEAKDVVQVNFPLEFSKQRDHPSRHNVHPSPFSS